MASTNKTTNILLSQFLGTDHFSFLTDYNGDMLKIDTYCGNLKTLIDGASGKTEQNTESIQNVQSDIQTIQSIQERQNNNITNNTNNITQLKEDNVIIKSSIDKNTKDIETLKQGSGTIIDVEVTKVSQTGMQAYVPRLKFNTKTNEFILVDNTSYNPSSVLNGISYIGKMNATNLPQKIKTILTRSTISGVVGYVKYLFTQTIDGASYSITISIPFICDIYSEDGTLNDITFALSTKSNLPAVDGDVISNPSYMISGLISLADKVV